jgi:hypothetical protein
MVYPDFKLRWGSPSFLDQLVLAQIQR